MSRSQSAYCSSTLFTSDRCIFSLLCCYGNANLGAGLLQVIQSWTKPSNVYRKAPLAIQVHCGRLMLVAKRTQRTRMGQILANAIVAGGFMAFKALAAQPGLLLLLIILFFLLLFVTFSVHFFCNLLERGPEVEKRSSTFAVESTCV